MIAGYQHSTMHDAVIMIDGDLQHPPEYIPQMIEVTLKVMIKWLLRNRQGEFCVKLCLVVIIN